MSLYNSRVLFLHRGILQNKELESFFNVPAITKFFYLLDHDWTNFRALSFLKCFPMLMLNKKN